MAVPTHYPINGFIRLAVTLPCGCESRLDIPDTIFSKAEDDGVPPGQGQYFIIGMFGSDLLRQLQLMPHFDEKHEPAVYFHNITETAI